MRFTSSDIVHAVTKLAFDYRASRAGILHCNKEDLYQFFVHLQEAYKFKGQYRDLLKERTKELNRFGVNMIKVLPNGEAPYVTRFGGVRQQGATQEERIYLD